MISLYFLDDETAIKLFIATICIISLIAAFQSMYQAINATNQAVNQSINQAIHVKSLYVYPVKGCAGVSVKEAVIDRLGFVNDRRFIIVRGSISQLINQTINQSSDQLNEATIKQIVDHYNPLISTLPTMISQRQQPKLALIQPSFQSNSQSTNQSNASSINQSNNESINQTNSPSTNQLILSYPGKPSLTIPTKPPAGSRVLLIKLWSQVVLVSLYDSAPQSTSQSVNQPISQSISEWLSDVIGESCALCTLLDGDESRQYRPVDEEYDINQSINQSVKINHQTTLSDGYPFLLASESSLRDLAKQVKQLNPSSTKQVQMIAFRPNIIVDGPSANQSINRSNHILPPWIEDQWRTLRTVHTHEPVYFTCAKPCDRCQVPTIDQSTGIPDKDYEPIMTMRTTRNYQAVLRHINQSINQSDKPDDESRVYFGENCICHSSTGVVHVGDLVQVVEWKPKGVFVEKAVDRH